MTNKEIVKCLLAETAVTDGEKIYPKVVDYTITCNEDGSMTNTAGVIGEDRLYREVLCEKLSFAGEKPGVPQLTPKWMSRYDTKTFIQAMKEKTPVTVEGLQYVRADKLSIRRLPGRIEDCLCYVVRCVDKQGNTLTARAEAAVFDGVPVAEQESSEESAA